MSPKLLVATVPVLTWGIHSSVLFQVSPIDYLITPMKHTTGKHAGSQECLIRIMWCQIMETHGAKSATRICDEFELDVFNDKTDYK